MRDLSGTLLEAEQVKPSVTPYVSVYLSKMEYNPPFQVVAGTPLRIHTLARESGGRLWACYKCSDHSEISYSDDDGENWTDDTDFSTGNLLNDIAIAVDSSDNLHAFYELLGSGTSRMRYRMRSAAGVWGSVVTISIPGGYSPGTIKGGPDIVVDSSDNVYLVWQDSYLFEQGGKIWTYGRIAYKKKTAGGSWSSTAWVGNVAYPEDLPSLAIDTTDTLHMFYQDADISNWAYKSKTISGSWTSPLAIGSVQARYGALVCDASGDVHAVWTDQVDSGTGILYCKRDAVTGWGDEEVVADIAVQHWVSISVNPSAEPTVSWTHTTNHIYLRKKTAGVWGETQDIGAPVWGYDEPYVPQISAYYPIIDGKHTNLAKVGVAILSRKAANSVHFWKTDDLAWE